MPRSSPCVGTCRIDETCGLCVGCARTRSEIKDWRTAGPDRLDRIWAELPSRRARLGIGLHRPAWDADDVRAFVRDSLRADAGTWVFGVFGAIAEFGIGLQDDVVRVVDASSVTAHTGRGAIRLEITDDIRPLALSGEGHDPARPGIVVLGTPRSQPIRAAEGGLLALGPDRGAIRPEDRNQRLYDLGIGRTSSRFCIRTGDAELIGELEGWAGRGWAELLAGLGGRILRASPTRVVTCPLGRVEVFTPIPPPGGRSPDGPHTHLLPAHLASGRETPPGIDVPETLVPSAVFYPGPVASCPPARPRPAGQGVRPASQS